MLAGCCTKHKVRDGCQPTGGSCAGWAVPMTLSTAPIWLLAAWALPPFPARSSHAQHDQPAHERQQANCRVPAGHGRNHAGHALRGPAEPPAVQALVDWSLHGSGVFDLLASGDQGCCA